MSTKERRRLAVLEQVEAGRLSLVAASARRGLSYRQMRRVFQRFKSEGDAGLVHRLRGQAGNRRVDPALRELAVSLYCEHYGDFGCTLACEYLAERHGLVVDDQTLRRWLASAGLWRRRRKSPVKRRRRERRASFGELVQIDGSHHDWFEGRAPVLPLVERVARHTGPQKPSADHPWRQGGPATRRSPAGPGSAPASVAPRPALRQARPAG